MNNKTGINHLSIRKYWKDLQPPDIRQLRQERRNFYDKTFPQIKIH